MSVRVEFAGRFVDLAVPEGLPIVAHAGPARSGPEAFRAAVAAALEAPLGHPPLRQAVVPGDHVTIAVGREAPGLGTVLAEVLAVLDRGEVERAAVTLLTEGPIEEAAAAAGTLHVVHDPGDRANLAYLASTKQGRRLYLNRALTDADLVILIGTLGPDPVLGQSGPWGTLFPALSDQATRDELWSQSRDEAPPTDQEWPALRESAEVGWLLGCPFQIGIEAGRDGPAGVIAGEGEALRQEARRRVEGAWTIAAEETADLVLAGIGAPWAPTTLDDLARGLANAAALVRQGGKIVAFARISDAEAPGTALTRLAERGAPALGTVRGERDFPAARRIAAALERADVYLFSNLNQDFVEDLGLVPLARPEQAQRLLNLAASGLALFPAERFIIRAGDRTDPRALAARGTR